MTRGRRIGVLGMGTYLPPAVRTNAEVARGADVTAEWISERTGVLERHVAAPDEAASDLAAHAVRAAADAAGIGLSEIGLLVCGTSTPDELGPSTACRIQTAVGAAGAVALDVSAACSGWLFAAKVAHDWLRGSEEIRYAAVVGVEAYSKFLDPADRGTAVLFADGAAAAVLGPVADGQGFTHFSLGSDGTLADRVLIPAGGSRRPASAATLADHGHCIRMDGRTIGRFITEVFPRLITDALDRAGLDIGDIDCFIAHQPNPVLLRRIGADLGIPAGRLVVVGDETGNIGAASAPFALARAASGQGLRTGDRVLVAVFGAGMTWGSALLTWSGAPAVTSVPVPATTLAEGLLR
ncbi:3-oxoacyl-ACP synthase III family protein [Streptomyces alanosinicus]|uniref:3-oxoacyl-ACP synthase III n=1 Tax=Streptomyces alanosinicus TaxID=68171 RepID=A0A918YIY5_9ACTN|nr:ketoacyl-ACP synthase III [Streptomyces alanosinicus]GHE05667.1 3-oxoacyl-ACP synthase III [Streptomyces alanosinicus]